MKNIILIGMPGTGKSTIGPRIATKLAIKFIDTDDIIEDQVGMSLADIISEKGEQYFVNAEERAAKAVPKSNHVVATGGSLATNKRAIEILKNTGVVIHLTIDLEVIMQRLGPDRLARIIGMKDNDLEKLFKDRNFYYEKYSDATLKLIPNGKGSNTVRLLRLLEDII